MSYPRYGPPEAGKWSPWRETAWQDGNSRDARPLEVTDWPQVVAGYSADNHGELYSLAIVNAEGAVQTAGWHESYSGISLTESPAGACLTHVSGSERQNDWRLRLHWAL